MRIALVAVPLLMGCAAVPPGEEPVPVAGEAGDNRCNTGPLSGLVGRQADQALGAEALRLSGARVLRWIRPDDAVTMDYSEQRLNIHLDARGRVERFACG